MSEPGGVDSDKYSGSYRTLTDAVVEKWLGSKDESPGKLVDAAFRDGESEALADAATDAEEDGSGPSCTKLTEVLSELVWRVASGKLPPAIVVKYLASDKPFARRLQGGAGADATPIAEALCDTLWGVDAMERGNVSIIKLDSLSGSKSWNRLCELVRQLREAKIIPEKLLLSLLSEELLAGSGVIPPPSVPPRGSKPSTILGRQSLKKNTEMVYKQRRYNLQREETEGFAKLIVLLGGVVESNADESAENMRRLIGYFDLDPNRALDLALDALEADPANRGLLRVVGQFKRESVPHVMGFKLRHYREESVRKIHRAKLRQALNKKEISAATYQEEYHKVRSVIET